MEKNYDPKAIEEKWSRIWLEKNVFHGNSEAGGEPYCVVIPPPNVTGILHMGHALNNTIQDILVRWRRMQGRNVVWMPGTDHAGIATQNVVERALRAEGKKRDDLGRAAFVERVWRWRAECGGTIIRQLKRLGASCDWQRERFTMDEGLSDAVAEVFVRLFEKGLIYRADYIINWCPRCHTALSDEESEHVDTNGKLYYLRYPLDRFNQGASPADYIVVATTRPETLLGDVAVAVNPGDERYAGLAGRKVFLPVLGRELAVIRDDFVDRGFGTGVVKVTPAHDPNDFQMGLRHGLAQVNVMNGDGTMNGEAGPYAGLDRFACRKQILKDLEASGLIEKIEEHKHAVGHCYRCDTVVEPRLSPQWFVKMKPLAEPAIRAVEEGRVSFVPQRWNKVYLEWMRNIRDWCISRQIWWGHRIPVFYCDSCGKVWAAKGRPEKCPACLAGNIRQDEDVLDTWFSSWLWPFSTFGWPGSSRDLSFYYPTHDLVTASEIIFFWVARMVMSGFEFMGDIPFRTVYIHGTVRDDKGRKMSKSLGNSIDPLTVIEEFSADALRFSLTMLTATGQDVYISNDKFEIGRNFGTKLWNAARFMRMRDERPASEHRRFAGHVDLRWFLKELAPALLSADDKHVVARLQTAIRDCNDSLEKYRFNDAALALYDFVWHQFCDWYVESAKDALYGADVARRTQVLGLMDCVLETALRLLQPMVPFLTEELWHAMGYGAEDEHLLRVAWPRALDAAELAKLGIDEASVRYVEQKHELIRLARTLKADYGIAASRKVSYTIKPYDAENGRLLRADATSLGSLLKAESLAIEDSPVLSGVVPCVVTELGTVYMPIGGLVDVAEELKKQRAQLDKVQAELRQVTAKLENEAFVGKAPEAVVEQQRGRRRELGEKAEKIQRIVQTLES